MEDFNGEIMLDGSIILSSNYTLEDYKKSALFDEREDTSIFFWIDKVCEYKNHMFKVGLCFREGVLGFIDLYCMDDNIRDEHERTRFHQEFVKRIAKKNEYNWGKIEACFDPRESYSTVIIRYKLSIYEEPIST